MILLTNTTHILEVETSVAGSVDYIISYIDITSSAYTPGSNQGNITTATTTTVVAAPAVSTYRQVKSMSINNKGTTAQTIKIKKDISGTEYILYNVTLAIGEIILYEDAAGFSIIDRSGRAKIYNSDSSGVDGVSQAYYKVGTAPEAAGVWYCHSKDTGTPGAWSVGTPGMAGRNTDGTAAADAGCLPLKTPASGYNYLTGYTVSSTIACPHFLFDVLWVNTGIAVTTLTAQTVNSGAFPARDITGSVNGEGCWVGILVTTATTNAGAITNTTLTYTNSAGTGSRTATMSSFPATAVIGSVVWFQLAAGDTGVQSIQSVTLGTSYGGGAISLIVARPLVASPILVANVGTTSSIDPNTGIKLYTGTCILPFLIAPGTTASTTTGLITISNR